MLILNNIDFEFGARTLYHQCFWHIKPNEKIGLIGPNGCGKSTLLRVIAGEYQPNRGNVSKRRDLEMGYLNQDLLSVVSDKTILEVAMEGFARAMEVKHEMEKVVEQMEHDHSEATLNRYTHLHTEYEALDGYNLQHKAETVLEGLGFTTKDLERPLKEFSGGWRMRVMLGKILLQQPQLLLLDEPTNHLDLPSIEWLEDYLVNYSGTVIIVSHDRYFLDLVVNRIAEVDQQKITVYTGNYSDYLEEKAQRTELLRNQAKNQERFFKQQEDLINRFRAKASKAKMVQSRIKALEKLDRVDFDDSTGPQIHIKFNFSQQPGKLITQGTVLSKKYPSGEVISNSKVLVNRGDKIALIGANGRGKSTMLRIIAGEEAYEGKIELGHNVVLSFFAQHQLESLNIENDLLRELQETAPEIEDSQLRRLLGAFLFAGDDVFKKIKVLSGGERSRVALAKTILAKANFLLLDEPTNHLDMQAVNTLIRVLNEFDGSFVVVSHDRFFLAEIANKIWYIENKELKEYPGTYEEYEDWLALRKEEEKELKDAKTAQEKAAKKEEAAALTEVIKTASPKLEKKPSSTSLKNSIKKAEEKIAAHENKISEVEKRLADPESFSDPQKMQTLSDEYKLLKDQLVELNLAWEELYMQLEE